MPAKFLLDENVPFEVARSLREAGYDIATVSEAAFAGISNAELAQRAISLQRILITRDADHPTERHILLPRKDFQALAATQPGKEGEIQLTDAIQKLIEWRHTVRAIKLHPTDLRLDIGTPQSYWEAQKLSYQYFSRKGSSPRSDRKHPKQIVRGR